MKAHPLDTGALQAHRRALRRRDHTQADAMLWQALDQESNLPATHLALARRRWPGMDYLQWLQWFHDTVKPALYVEIGVERGESLSRVNASTRALAIDPAPLDNPTTKCKAPVQLFQQTSAEFFAAPPKNCGLYEAGFDLAFIDGDHRFEGVLDDFIALERWAAPDALVLIHDTVPLTSTTATGQRRTGFYSGDGWKIVPCLLSLRPDLRLVTLPTAPTGLTVVTGLNRNSSLLESRRPLIHQAYARLADTHIIDNPTAYLNLAPNDTAWLQAWLTQARGQ